jgi:hypothetical protein
VRFAFSWLTCFGATFTVLAVDVDVEDRLGRTIPTILADFITSFANGVSVVGAFLFRPFPLVNNGLRLSI